MFEMLREDSGLISQRTPRPGCPTSGPKGPKEVIEFPIAQNMVLQPVACTPSFPVSVRLPDTFGRKLT